MSKQSGIERLVAHLFGGMIGVFAGRWEGGIPALFIAITMIVVFILSINILIQNKMDNWGMRKIIFVSMMVSFMLPRIPALLGKETFSTVFSMILYGQYVALFCSIGLVLFGKRVMEYEE